MHRIQIQETEDNRLMRVHAALKRPFVLFKKIIINTVIQIIY